MPRSYYDAVICILSMQNIHRTQYLKCKVNCEQTLFLSDDDDEWRFDVKKIKDYVSFWMDH